MGDASKIPKRNNWDFFKKYVNMSEEYSMEDLINYYIGNMFNRTLMMFKWNNLPDNMTSYDMEKFTQLKGCSFFIHDKKDGDRYYILDGSKYDNITWNFEPSKSLIVNPALEGLKEKYDLNKDCVMLRNDKLCLGLYIILEKNAIDIANTDTSLRYAQFNTRFKTLFTSDDDNTKDSLDLLITKIWNGKAPVAIVSQDLYKKSVEGIAYNTTANNDIGSLIQLKQYQLAQFFIELGINANYNMKKESVSADEFRMNDDALLPLIDQMLECRKEACEQINNLFGLKISVELNSAWLKIAKEVVNEVAKEEAEVEKLEAEADAVETAAAEESENIKEGEDDADKAEGTN